MLQLIEANESHSEMLKKFFADQVVNGHVDYSIRRPNSFFDHYRLISKDFTTALLMDGDHLVGAASILFIKGYVNRQEQLFGYLCDLRISQQRTAIQHWSEYFIPYYYKKIAEKNCKYVFTCIEQFENQAYNALIRPRRVKRNMPTYYLMRKLNLAFFLGRWPWSPNPIPAIRISHGWGSDLDELCDYMMQKKVGSRVFINADKDLLMERFEKWPDFSISNFLIARNYKDEIIGCMAPWNNRQDQQYIVRGYRPEADLLKQSLGVTSLLRISQYLPEIGSPFEFKYISHCAVDNPEVFFSLLCQAYSETQRGEILVHTNYFGDFQTRPPLSFITTKIPFGFYSVFPPDEEIPAFLKPNPFAPAPDFNLLHL
ncbi:MAG: hypothetical protein H6623_07815 [Bdellovibrionaceae bacterium]|nr:hypothetical protein [Pseudobdellovibrionaceae bacterium]